MGQSQTSTLTMAVKNCWSEFPWEPGEEVVHIPAWSVGGNQGRLPGGGSGWVEFWLSWEVSAGILGSKGTGGAVLEQVQGSNRRFGIQMAPIV